MTNKIVCFAGHRYEWHNIDIEEKLKNSIIALINKGYNIFYIGDNGYFDKLCEDTLLNLIKTYRHLQIYKILSHYKSDKKLNAIETIFPEIEKYHYKLRIVKRNEWIVDNADILVCHIINTFNSGAYRMVKYALKQNKKVIYI